MTEPEPSNNDPTPEERKGDSSFLPVVIAAGLALILILVIAAIVLHHRGIDLIPQTRDLHPATQTAPPTTAASTQPSLRPQAA